MRVPFQWRVAYAPDGGAGSGGKPADPPPTDGKPAGQSPLPGITPKVDWKARAEAAEATAAKAADADRKVKADADRKVKADAKKKTDADATKKAIEDGKAAEALEKANADKAALTSDKEALEVSFRERIERNMAKLPKEVQDEIAEVKDHLPLNKLDALVEKRLGNITVEPAKPTKGAVPPPGGVKGSDITKDGAHQIHAETKETLRDLYAKPGVYKVAEQLGVGSDGRFGWQRSDDDKQNTANFIDLMDNMKFQPIGAPDVDAVYDRVLKKG